MKKNNTCVKLFSCCKLVKGFNDSIIYDVQGKRYFKIPFFFMDLLTKSKLKSIEEIKESHLQEDHKMIDNFFNFLYDNELIFSTNLKYTSCFSDSNLCWESPHLLGNFILDTDEHSHHDYLKIVTDLSELNLQTIQLRFFCKIEKKSIIDLFQLIMNSNIRAIELIIPFNDSISLFETKELINKFSKVTSVTIFNSPQVKSIYVKQGVLIYLNEKINDSNSCGVISKEIFMCNKTLFSEAQDYNTCLNRKASIDSKGFIKNCPANQKSYGKNKNIKEIISSDEFQKYWFIKKDDIEVCQDCEYRYMCTDCRVFIKNTGNICSQPAKCNYNPYISKWQGDEGYVPVEACGAYNVEGKFIVNKVKIDSLNFELRGE